MKCEAMKRLHQHLHEGKELVTVYKGQWLANLGLRTSLTFPLHCLCVFLIIIICYAHEAATYSYFYSGYSFPLSLFLLSSRSLSLSLSLSCLCFLVFLIENINY